jgi:hypothetical protein
MKYYLFLFLVILVSFKSYSQEQKEVLVEVFTNSHCPLCPNAHNTFDVFLDTNPNADKTNYIFYHMVYPYSDDQLYIQSAFDSDARHAFYNPIAATPRGFFDGIPQGPVSLWIDTLNVLTQSQSPLKINLNGTKNGNQLSIDAEITRTGNISDNYLMLHFVVVEDLFYQGRNLISHHKHVMRKMLPTPEGQSFSINLNETKMFNQVVSIDSLWDVDSLNVVVFVQNDSSKTVYQSETIDYRDLTATAVANNNQAPEEFFLSQNYPNPFNPATKIKYQVPRVISTGGKNLFVSLKVYDVLGNEVSSLVNEEKSAGKYEVEFDAVNLSSGIYFYALKAGNVRLTKKMILLK